MGLIMSAEYITLISLTLGFEAYIEKIKKNIDFNIRKYIW